MSLLGPGDGCHFQLWTRSVGCYGSPHFNFATRCRRFQICMAYWKFLFSHLTVAALELLPVAAGVLPCLHRHFNLNRSLFCLMGPSANGKRLLLGAFFFTQHTRMNAMLPKKTDQARKNSCEIQNWGKLHYGKSWICYVFGTDLNRRTTFLCRRGPCRAEEKLYGFFFFSFWERMWYE